MISDFLFGYNQAGSRSILKYLVTLEDYEDGWIVAECPSIPGCVSQGRTEEEALDSIREAILLYFEVREEFGMQSCQNLASNEMEAYLTVSLY